MKYLPGFGGSPLSRATLSFVVQADGVDSVYLDFSKAFDKVETGVLLHTLRDSKVLGKVGIWIGQFLDSSKRQQAVAVEGRLSSLSPVISGVPQGTVLGPILFLLPISGIAKEVSAQSTVSSYVDDTRVTRPINNPSLDCQAMQQDLQAIYKWAEQVNIVFNGNKFDMLRFWPGKTPQPYHRYSDQRRIHGGEISPKRPRCAGI